MNGTTGRTRILALTLCLGIMAGRADPAGAQWHSTGYGVAEYDTKETLLLLAGISATPGGRGWSPLLSLQAYHLGFDAGSSRTNVFTVKPAIGLRNGMENGSVSATVGYAFSNRETERPVVSSDQGDGVVTSVGLDWTPRGSAWQSQLLGSYNFGSESFWTRGRATTRVGAGGETITRFGGEVAYLSGTNYQALQPGLVMSWQRQSGSTVALGAGAKFIEDGGTAAYFKLEFGLPLFR
jgi:hypothetical protein